MTASMLKMSGRIYNAMMKFAGGTKTAPQLANMFFSNGKVYTTNSFVVCRWTPAFECEVIDNETHKKLDRFFFTPRMDKIPAGTTIYIGGIGCDIDSHSQMITSENLDKFFNDTWQHPIDMVMGVNPDYLAAIAALGKAVKADKCGANGTTDIDWTQKVLRAHINAGCNGYFDVIVMPCVDRTKTKKE